MNVTNLDKRFSSFILKKRNELGLKQTDLALKSGISRNSIAKIEAGGVGPSLSTAVKLLMGLGTDLVSFEEYLQSNDLEQNLASEIGSDIVQDLFKNWE